LASKWRIRFRSSRGGVHAKGLASRAKASWRCPSEEEKQRKMHKKRKKTHKFLFLSNFVLTLQTLSERRAHKGQFSAQRATHKKAQRQGLHRAGNPRVKQG